MFSARFDGGPIEQMLSCGVPFFWYHKFCFIYSPWYSFGLGIPQLGFWHPGLCTATQAPSLQGRFAKFSGFFVTESMISWWWLQMLAKASGIWPPNTWGGCTKKKAPWLLCVPSTTARWLLPHILLTRTGFITLCIYLGFETSIFFWLWNSGCLNNTVRT